MLILNGEVCLEGMANIQEADCHHICTDQKVWHSKMACQEKHMEEFTRRELNEAREVKGEITQQSRNTFSSNY